jgi:hypothetical protein
VTDETAGQEASSNPFATRFVKPGALPFVFAAGGTIGDLVARFAANGWRGAIIGPHGSGKSTLLEGLLAELRARNCSVLEYRLHDKQRRLPGSPAREVVRVAAAVIAVDGYEQLGRIARWQLSWLCRRRGVGLLVTAHAPVELPTLYRTGPTPALFQSLVKQLLAGEFSIAWREAAEHVYSQRHGDVREALFDLYDAYEVQRRA